MNAQSNVIRESYDHIRTWVDPDGYGFRLEVWDTYQFNWNKCVLAYQFYHNDVLIFEGDDYCPSPLHSIDGDDSIAGLLCFLALRPGDTDPEYFDSYTPEQLAWAQRWGEELSMYVDILECRDQE